jgi:cytochrome P450
MVRLMWFASSFTTMRVISHCVRRLAGDTQLSQTLKSNPGLLTNFIEEIIRLHPPAGRRLERVTTKSACLADVIIPPGAIVSLAVAHANRDPARWEQPNELRLDRQPLPSLSFGHGIHHCIGASLGRRIAEIAIGKLLEGERNPRRDEPIGKKGGSRTRKPLSPEPQAIRL